MVARVTNRLMQNNALNNIFRITENLSQTQNEISSGKRINKPSDDPAGLRDVLELNATINQANQYVRNIDTNRLLLNSGDTALNSIGTSLSRAKELAVSQLNGAATPETRQFTANEIDKLISLVLQSGNTSVKGQYIFAGTNTKTLPFTVNSSGEAEYAGNTESFQIEIAKGFQAGVSLPGSDVMATDLNPTVTSSTLLSSLNKGTGVPAGSFTITNRSGNAATIAVTAGMTVGNLLSAINSAGINVTASINSKQNGILLTDTSSVIRQGLTVAEAGSGTTAQKLGLLGQRDGNLDGGDLNPILTANTSLAQLKGGTGLSLTSVNIVNGGASGTVTLSSASTIGDVVNLINNSGLNVTASVNSQGNALRLVSNNSSTVAVASESGSGASAQDLGIGGGRNALTNLLTLKSALLKNDQYGILASLKNLDASLNSVNDGRASLGAVLGRVDNAKTVHDADVVDLTKQATDIAGADVVQKASDLAQLQTALQATLSTTSRIIQPSLLDFLR